MVKLAVLPDYGTIRALKKKIDFYDWKGVHVARRWPRKPLKPLSAAALQQQRWLQIAMGHYRASSTLVKAEFRWLVAASTWTPRDAFMAHYFGTLPAPWEGVRPPDPNQPPYPIPDPHNHYCAVLARLMWIYFPGKPVMHIDTTQQADWHMFYATSPVSFEWGHRTRYGHTYPTAPAWRHVGPFNAKPMTHFGDNIYAIAFDQFLPVAGEKILYFWFRIDPDAPAYAARGHSPMFAVRLFAPWMYPQGFASPCGGLLHTHGPSLRLPHYPFHAPVLYPPSCAYWPGTDFPVPPGPTHIPPS